MKLYGFQPKGHGQISFFVCACSKEDAFMRVTGYIEAKLKIDHFSDYDVKGWNTEYYNIKELNHGEVIHNAND